MNAIDITPIANALVALVAAVMSAVVLPWVKKKHDAEDLIEFLRWVEIGVGAAEQLFNPSDGVKKKAYVVNYLEAKGYTLDVDDLENAIEAAVLKLHTDLYGTCTYNNIAQPLEVATPGWVSTTLFSSHTDGGDTIAE